MTTAAVEGVTFRSATAADWEAIAGIANRSNQSDGIDEIRSGEEMRTDHEPLDHFDLARDVLIAEVEGRAVAFLMGYRVLRGSVLTLETWGGVLPEHQGRGIGTALIRTTRARLATEAAADPRPEPRQFRTFAMDAEHAALRLLDAEGYVPIRYGFEMRRALTGELPEPPMPEGLEMRPVTPDQHRAIFDADNEAFRDHWGIREPGEGDFVRMFESPTTDTSLWCVGWEGDEIAGVVINAIYREENEALGVSRGWLEHVSVRRRWRGRGLAKALCAASFRVFREQNIEEAWLGVDGANPTGALGLYEGLGFLVARRWQVFARPLDGPAPAGWQPAE